MFTPRIYPPLSSLRTYFFIALYILGVHSTFAQNIDRHGNPTVNSFTRVAQVSIEADQISYVKDAHIPVRIRIGNSGKEILRIYPSEETILSYKFFITNSNGTEIKAISTNSKKEDKVEKTELTEIEHIAKEVIIAPGEVFEKTLYIDEYYKLIPGEKYKVWLYFHPAPLDPNYANILLRSSNHLNLYIEKEENKKPALKYLTQTSVNIEPKEIVFLFLTAEKNRNYQNYLKYLELEKLIKAYPVFALKFENTSSNDEKKDLLQEFSHFLINNSKHPLSKFKIIDSYPENLSFLNSNINNDEPIKEKDDLELREEDKAINNSSPRYIVRAICHRKGKQMVANYKYTFTLENIKGSWKIVYVDVKIIPKE